MPALEYEGKKIQLDDEGYLVNLEDWDETVACALAEERRKSERVPPGEGAN